ncbi:MAG: ATP-binding protein [Bacteroidetes bacterium]|nr:ATP-binding protein [Bacteroidota bacterium]MBU1717648.1 ATP-binding protein [Bacteroidota bacterium]
MERHLFKKLEAWKDKKNRKPLIIRGARQVGKTWLMKSFGNKSFEQVAYINFEANEQLQTLFLDDFDISRILRAIRLVTNVEPVPGKTLIIFDEIQAAERGVTVLKYFCEEAPEFHIIAAGSLLGITLHKNTSFPVGKIEFLDLFPMNYVEFLMALGEKDLCALLLDADWKLITVFKHHYIERLRQYYYVGGMPEAVKAFVENDDYEEVREIQINILQTYENDFSKHAPAEIVPRIRMLWNSIPAQLARENKKFVYGLIKSGARAKDFEMALLWLEDSGLLHRVCRISKPALPIKSYEDYNAFKLFLSDVGLLSAMNKIDRSVLLNGNELFREFKGALTEQYVLQQLKTHPEYQINYWSAERSEGEVDFVIQTAGDIVPVEVKAEENLKAKSLMAFIRKYGLQRAIRLSMSDYREDNNLTNIPLYGVEHLKKSFAYQL